ncbi:MAG: hypothetical protein F6K65_06500 [Moorea sp. SIO3C2]|nr:hypothetical protein [Moorena sp. SIO3C2]
MNKYCVIKCYDEKHLPSSDSNFPNISDKYLYGVCLPIISEAENITVVRWGEQTLTVNSKFIVPIPTPKYQVGTLVKFIRLGELRFGRIAEIHWHWKNQSHLYDVIEKGKRLKKRYFEENLVVINK